MYEFRDTTDTSGGNILPSEALSLNGTYIENLIPSYQTLSVSGRELLGSEVESLQIGLSDGARYNRKRFPDRVITVQYQLICSDNESFREAYNKLNYVLNVEQAQLIFADEVDKYFIGTPEGAGNVPSGRNSITSTFDIYCADPRKYSVQETEVLPNADGEFIVDYEGTEKAFPVLEATMNGDNGFIGFVNDRERILQFGNPDEADGEDYKQNERLSTIQSFGSLANDTGTNRMHPNHVMNGSLTAGNVSGSNPAYCLHLNATANVSGKWHGGMRTFTIPADSEGDAGATNFYCYLNHWFETGRMGQTAEQSIAFLDANNKVICGYSIFKGDMSGNEAWIEFWVNGKIVRSIKFTPSYRDDQNPFNNNRGHNDIRKEGDAVTFYWWGSYPVFRDAAIKNMKCTKIQVAFTQFDNRGTGANYVTRNYLRALNFQKMYVEKWKNVPNKFMGSDSFYANCRTGEVLHNGLAAAGLGALGNDWEEFYLAPGVNQIKCLYSDWANKPEFKLRYREVYL